MSAIRASIRFFVLRVCTFDLNDQTFMGPGIIEGKEIKVDVIEM